MVFSSLESLVYSCYIIGSIVIVWLVGKGSKAVVQAYNRRKAGSSK